MQWARNAKSFRQQFIARESVAYLPQPFHVRFHRSPAHEIPPQSDHQIISWSRPSHRFTENADPRTFATKREPDEGRVENTTTQTKYEALIYLKSSPVCSHSFLPIPASCHSRKIPLSLFHIYTYSHQPNFSQKCLESGEGIRDNWSAQKAPRPKCKGMGGEGTIPDEILWLHTRTEPRGTNCDSSVRTELRQTAKTQLQLRSATLKL